METKKAMDNLKNLLESDPVPDPGEGYWREFPGRVSARLDADGPRAAGVRRPDAARTAARLLPAAAAAALFFFALSLPRLGVVRVGPVPAVMPGPSPSEAETTASLADSSGSESVIMILDRTATEKAGMAAAAFRRGDIGSLVPIVRSWEKLVRTGIIGSLRKANQNDEDIGAYSGRILDSAAAADAQWREMAAAVKGGEAGEALMTAIETAEALESAFGEANWKER